VLVAFAALAAPALADPSVPTGLTAVAVSDHEVDLSWSWPASPSYPDDLQVWRNGADIGSVSLPSTTFQDSAPAVGTTYSYRLVAIQGGLQYPTASVNATTRADLPNAPTNVAVSFAPSTNIATVTWTRGAQDADVTYNVTALQVGSTTTITATHHYNAGDTSPGSVTMDNFLSYGNYNFTVSAVEANESMSDPGGTVSAPVVSTRANDIIAPTFSSPVVTTTRTSVGAATVSWSSASDQGSGVASYAVCVDASCQTVAYDPLASTVTAAFTGIPSNGAQHPVTVTATDAAGNVSAATLTASVFMDALQPPSISLAPGIGDGCSQLTYQLVPTAIDGTNATLQLFVNNTPWPGGSVGVVSGAPLSPFDLVQLTAQASFGSDVSPVSPPISARVGDLDPPTDAPVLHGIANPGSSSETLSWDALTAVGAGVSGYRITSSNVPGYMGGGATIPQTSTPQLALPGLAQNVTYSVDVAAVDACQRLGPSTNIKFSISDVTPPSTPKITGSSSTTGSVTLTWSQASDNVQVEGYKIYQAGQLIADVGPNTLSYTVQGLVDASPYTFKVAAYDTAGNAGAQSDPKVVYTNDGTPPNPPGNPSVTIKSGIATITWKSAYDNVGVVRYLISRGGATSPGTPIGSSTTTSYVDRNVPAGSWVWTVVAEDAAGNQSKPRSTPQVITTASIKAVQATSVKVIPATGARLLRYGGKSGARMVLTFTLPRTVVPAQLTMRVLSGTAKVKISLPSGTGRTTPGKRIAERRAKKGTLVIPLGKMAQGKQRLIVTASQGKMVTLSAPKTAKKPTLSQK
jgi:hypothetical protein